MLKNLNASIPIYVTRQNADGYTGTWSVSAWMALLSIFFGLLNIFLWGVIGLVEGVRYFI